MILPTVTLFKDDRHIIVNETDEAEWTAKGWSRPSAAKIEPEPEPEPKAPPKRRR